MLRAGAVAALNLADRPLANRRPLRRVVVALWTLASVAWLSVAVVVTRHLMSSSAGNERLGELDTQIERSYDSYAFIRNAWLQRREFLVRDGDVADESLDLEQELLEDSAPDDAQPEESAPETPAPEAPSPEQGTQ